MAAPASPSGQARAERERARREGFMRIAARVFRAQGLSGATMEDVAAAAGVTKVVLYRRFASKDLLIRAIFEEAVGRLAAANADPWHGYGAGARMSLEAARGFEDGYLLLMRDGRQQAAYRGYYDAVRARTARRLLRLLWFPGRQAPRPVSQQLLDLSLEPMVSFCNDALAHWVEHGDPAQDDRYIRWCGVMIRAWRAEAAGLLGLEPLAQDWPFESENDGPLT
ncbi:MAG: TetR/AcrR family transcriptional regulator [Phenylobacterium sp.]|uniref:TetR/AcrR family transcriptional regulator n=1 Tax=Phenylobacterium sp. TaxID=1871053 RepID=UPI00391B8B5D